MASREQIVILKQGVENWNAWRQRHPNRRPNLLMANLRAARLAGANLKEADLSGADLSSADLSMADLRGAGLEKTVLVGADFREADRAVTAIAQAEGRTTGSPGP